MEAFNFGPTLTPQTLERFLVHCSNNEVSDILLQGGDKIWVERHGRQLPMTSYPLDNLELERTVDKVFGQEIKGTLKSAAVVNTAIQLRGDEAGTIGLGRGETRRFRANFTQADIYKTEAAMSLTLRVLNEVIPQLKQMGIEPDLFNSLLPAAGLGLICGETGSGKSTLMASIFQYCGETYGTGKSSRLKDPISIAREVETGLRRRRHSHRLGAILIPSTILSLSPGSVVLRRLWGLVSSLTACHLKLLYWQVNPATFVLAHCTSKRSEKPFPDHCRTIRRKCVKLPPLTC